MKKIIGILSLVVMVLLLLSACGIPQEEHDAVLAERDATQAKVASLQSELSQVQSDLSKAKSDLTQAQDQIETLKSDVADAEGQIDSLQSKVGSLQGQVSSAQGQLSSFKSDLSSSWASLEKKLELAAYLITYWAAAGVGEEQTVGQMTLNMVIPVDAVGDAELRQLWQEALSNAAQGEETLYMAVFTVTKD
ncbi:hypothetical protein ACFLTY_05105, partial [Chloroflexota bacterium]